MKRFLSLIALLLSVFPVFSQPNSNIDSLYTLLKQNIHDTTRIKIHIALSGKMPGTDSCLVLLRQAVHRAQQGNYLQLEAGAIHALANYYKNKTDLVKALELLEEAMIPARRSGAKQMEGIILQSKGEIYYEKGEFRPASEHLFRALKIYESLPDNKFLLTTLSNALGLLYYQNSMYDKAREWHLNTMKLARELGDSAYVMRAYNNLGSIEQQEKKFEQARQTYQKSLALTYQVGYKQGTALVLCNIAECDSKLGEYTKALQHAEAGVKLAQEIGFRRIIARGNVVLGEIYLKMNQTKKAIHYLEKGVELATDIQMHKDVRQGCESLYKAYEKDGQIAKAYQTYQRFIVARDSLDRMDNLRELLAKDAAHQEEKLKAGREKQELRYRAEKEYQSRVQSTYLGIVLTSLIVLGLLAAGYRQKQKANGLLSRQNQEILLQKNEIENQRRHTEHAYQQVQKINALLEYKNRKISDSINYARRLQAAILPPVEEIKAVFPESFVLFRPRDVVSGDFYYFARHENKVILSAIDCTGHGVPGAFMSMIGYELLNQVILTDQIYEPSRILQRMHTGVVSALRQEHENSQSNDGMDMVLCSIDLDKKELQVAAANNPLLLFNPNRNEPMMEIKGDKRAIGGKYGRDSSFKNHVIALQDQDTVYFFSDGYADQFGGTENRKFMIKRFRQLLSGIQALSMEQQKQVLEKELIAWMGDHEQVDDILVIGIRFPLKEVSESVIGMDALER